MRAASRKQSVATAAHEWRIRLQNNPSRADREEFLDWFARTPQNEQQYLLLLGVADRLEALRTQAPRAYEQLLKSAGEPRAQWWIRRLWWSAPGLAALIAVTAVCCWLWAPQPQASDQELTAGTRGQPTHLIDGSVVQLDTAGTAHWQATLATRELQLEQGTILVTVARDPFGRPFRVRNRHFVLDDQGTTFMLTALQAGLRVLVLEGEVRLSADCSAPGVARAAAIQLGARQEISVSDSGCGQRVLPRTLSQAEVLQRTAWSLPQARFDETPLREAAERFNRYNEQQISVADEVAAIAVSGDFWLDDPAEFARAAAELTGVHMELFTRSADSNRIYLRGAGAIRTLKGH